MGLWGPGYEVVVDPYTNASQGMVNVTSSSSPTLPSGTRRRSS